MALRFKTFNSTGLAQDKRHFINKILDDSDFLFLQEHWLHKPDLSELNELHPNFLSNACSGMKESKLHKRGRPYGGAAILYRDSFSHQITHIDNVVHNVVAIQAKQCLIVSAYFPGDNRQMLNASTDFKDTLNGIAGIMLRNDHQSLIIGGDLNIDLQRPYAHTQLMIDFAERHGLHFVQSHRLSDYTATYRQPLSAGGERTSCVDHFLVSADIFDSIKDVSLVDSIDNSSFHSPLSFTFDCGLLDGRDIPDEEHSDSQPIGIAWHKVNDNHIKLYQTAVTNSIKSRQLPQALFCNNVRCKCKNHQEQLDEHCDFLVKTCVDVADKCLPKLPKSREPKRVPYWYLYVNFL